MRHSDFIVYVDESGDHSLSAINARYPLFVLALCVMHKASYNRLVAPAVRGLKFRTFGHDMVVLHEADIRKRKGAFAGMARDTCAGFLDELTTLIGRADFGIVAVIIEKLRWKAQGSDAGHAYEIALRAALELLFGQLRELDQDDRCVHIVCEARGAQEDARLAAEFEKMCLKGDYEARGIRFELVIADKKTNSEGLQLADLTARPIGLSVLRPQQPNRAVEVIKRKLKACLNLQPSDSDTTPADAWHGRR